MPKPTKPTVPDPAVRSQPDTFNANVEANVLFWSTLTTYMDETSDFVDQMASDALAAATGGDLPALTGKAHEVLRVNSGETAAEFASIAQLLLDANGNEQLTFSAVTSAVNYLRILNAATGNAPELAALGDDANIGLAIKPKGSGRVSITQPNLVMGSDADGDLYYRSGGNLARLPKGTSGQVLKMNSGATAPEWTTVGELVASIAFGAVGSQVLGYYEGDVLTEGQTIAGSNLQPASLLNTGASTSDDTFNGASFTKGGSALSGTWRLMGRSGMTGTPRMRIGLFVRIV